MSDTTKKLIRYGMIIVGIVLIVVCATRFARAYTDFHQKITDADLRIAEYRKEILSETARLEAAENEQKEQQASVINMKNEGIAVAEAQTKLMFLPVRFAATGDAGLQEQMDSLIKTSASYFSDDSAEIWYAANSKVNNTNSWACVTTYDIRTTQNVSCLWICRSADEKSILAYATAIYDIKAKTFSNLQLYHTQTGLKNMYVEG